MSFPLPTIVWCGLPDESCSLHFMAYARSWFGLHEKAHVRPLCHLYFHTFIIPTIGFAWQGDTEYQSIIIVFQYYLIAPRFAVEIRN